MSKKIGICYSKEITSIDPLDHIGPKLPVYLELLDRINNAGWQAYVLTRKTYLGNGIFNGGWSYVDRKLKIENCKLKIDLVYDRTGGISFPPENDNLNVINNRQFKVLAWDKQATFAEIGEYMPKTVWVGELSNLPKVIGEIATNTVVLKPFNGLKGNGIFIGEKNEALLFHPQKKYQYILQEFVDTSKGLPGIAEGLHDLRVVVINGQVVWCHVREPQLGKLLANAALGGKLTEVDYLQVPERIKDIVKIISTKFTAKYDNPIYSLDFGLDITGTPKIYEINDQIGFPQVGMKNKDAFLSELILNFKSKLT